MSEWQEGRLRQVEKEVAELPKDPAVLILLIERRYLLEDLGWDFCSEWVALKRAITNTNS